MLLVAPELYEIDVLYADKHESFLQADIIIFDGVGHGTMARLQWLCYILKKKLGMKLGT